MKQPLFQCMLLVIISISNINLNAQPYHPMPVSGGQWNVTRCWYFYPGGWHDEYSISLAGGDTTINNHVYKKLLIQIHHAPGTEFDSIYTHFLGAMREANKQVFFISEYQCIDTIERMVYDFNNTFPGDTIYTQVLTNGLTQTIPHIVISIDSVLIGEELHRRINLTDESGFFYESWTEGVGSSLGLTYASYWLLTDNSYDLNCFYSDDELQYINPQPAYAFCSAPLPDIHCSLTTAVEPVTLEQKIIVYPNPAFDELTFSSKVDFYKVIISNELGVNLISGGYTPSIDINSLVPGIYFIQFMDQHNELIAFSKFVKQ
ncbi:MAG TPA: T9SS type A sorting domain-containing protein [Saprospiraceae bacterium]|nr:T9SS type A sorting domain-containing protein [Saprospiraceae bacterium]